MTRYIIIGAGAVGASLAAQLAGATIPYVLVGRGENIARIAADGLRYNRQGVTSVVLLSTATSPEDVVLDSGDVLVLTTKVHDLEDVVRQWAWQPLADGAGSAADLPVITLQNGLDSERIALRRFGTVYGASILVPARHTAAGEVVLGSGETVGVITAGRYPDGSDDRLAEIADDLRAAGYVVQLSEDVLRWKAAKILHSVKNGVEVLSGSAEDTARLGDLLVAEAAAALAAAGISVADSVGERTEDVSGFGLDPASAIKPGQQSTWQSFARGTATEIDYLNGEIVLLGRLHGVATPANAALQKVLGAASTAAEGPGSRTAASVLALVDATSAATVSAGIPA